MGRQQLLRVLGAIVIGGAVISLGVSACTDNANRNNYDLVLKDMVRIAGDAQIWKNKPELMGGSDDALKGESRNFKGVNFATMGYHNAEIFGPNGVCYSNSNGQYELIGFYDGLAILARNESRETLVVGVVKGPNPGDLEIIGILRGGQFVETGASLRGQVPSLPSC